MTRDEATMIISVKGHIPSVNGLYKLHRPVSKSDSARIYLSDKGEKFKVLFKRVADAAGLRGIFEAHGLSGKELEATIIFYFPAIYESDGTPVRVDADNPEKALFDSLAAAFGMDDSYFFKHTTEKRQGERGTEVRVRPWVPLVD